MLLLELERHVRRLEEGEAGAVVQPVEGVQRLGLAAALGLLDLERLDERQPEEFLVELARLFRVAAAVGVVVQTFDHGQTFSNGPFSDAAKPSTTSKVLDQLFSFFMLPSQRLMFG